MNCERCQELISELVDGSLGPKDSAALHVHLEECLECAEVRKDFESLLSFCKADREHYEAPPNEQALWLRIRNTIEATNGAYVSNATRSERKRSWGDFLKRSWQLNFPQLAASVAAIVLIVSLTTVVGIRLHDSRSSEPPVVNTGYKNDRMAQQQQTISYWNARIETNRARWSPKMRDTFDRNLALIDQTVNRSLGELNNNPHDEISEEMLNTALNEKITLLKEFSELE
jgi:Putative zinc-finger